MSEDLLADGEGTPLGMPIVDRVLAYAGKSKLRVAVRELRRKPELSTGRASKGRGAGRVGVQVRTRTWLVALQGDCLLYPQEHPFFTSHKTKKTDIAAFVKEILGEDS